MPHPSWTMSRDPEGRSQPAAGSLGPRDKAYTWTLCLRLRRGDVWLPRDTMSDWDTDSGSLSVRGTAASKVSHPCQRLVLGLLQFSLFLFVCFLEQAGFPGYQGVIVPWGYDTQLSREETQTLLCLAPCLRPSLANLQALLPCLDFQGY